MARTVIVTMHPVGLCQGYAHLAMFMLIAHVLVISCIVGPRDSNTSVHFFPLDHHPFYCCCFVLFLFLFVSLFLITDFDTYMIFLFLFLFVCFFS